MPIRPDVGLNEFIRQTAGGKYDLYIESFGEVFAWLTQRVCAIYPDLDIYQAETVAQSTMLKIIEKGVQYKGESDCEARNWLLTIAYHDALNLIRLEGREVSLDARAVESFDGESLIDKNDWEWIEQQLSVREKDVLNLYMDGYLPSEIATRLGVSKPRITELLHRIKTVIRRYFDLL